MKLSEIVLNSSFIKVVIVVSTALYLGLLSVFVISALQAMSLKTNAKEMYALAAEYTAITPETNTSKLAIQTKQLLDELAVSVETTQSFTWQVMETFPLVGENFLAVSKALETSKQVLSDVALPGLPLLEKVTKDSGVFANGGINTTTLAEVLSFMATSEDVLSNAQNALDSINSALLLPEVRQGVEQLSEQVSLLHKASLLAAEYSPTLESMLGIDEEKHYLVVFQNPAEMRPLGGLPGSILLMTVKDGNFSIDRQTSASTSIYSPQSGSDFALSTPEKVELFYEDANRIMAQAMNTTSFTEAAQRVIGHWSRAFPESIDGVISIDPVALGYLLKSFGPLTTDAGIVLDEHTLSKYLLHDVYTITDSNIEQDALYAEVVEKFVDKFKEGNISFPEFLEGIQQSTKESRLLFWSSDSLQNQLSAQLGMTVESPSFNTHEAELGVYFMFAQGSKMYYFLEQAVSVKSIFCPHNNEQTVKVSYQLSNALASEEADDLAPSIWAVSHVEPKGAILSRVMVYAPPGATIQSVAPSNPNDAILVTKEGENPVARVDTLLPPSSQGTVEVTYSFETKKEKPISLYVTPLSQPTKTVVEHVSCSK